MADRKIEFLFLNEEDMIRAGVTDMKRCVEVMEEMFELLGKGDYRMGSKNHNAHGIMVDFPKKSALSRHARTGGRIAVLCPCRRIWAAGFKSAGISGTVPTGKTKSRGCRVPF